MSDSDDDPLVTKPFKFVTGEYFAVKLVSFAWLTSKPHLAGKFVRIPDLIRHRHRSIPGKPSLTLILRRYLGDAKS